MTNRRRGRVLLGTLASLAMLAAACGGGGDSADSNERNGGDAGGGDPVYGGELVYGMEAESSGGWCLAESQLAISGIQVARAIYDTLTVPNEDGEFVGMLAESVEPNEDFTQWTINLREGVTFHDGTALNSSVVKNNIDAWRGQYPARTPLLLIFAYAPITDVSVTDDLTLSVTTDVSWPAFPSYLYYTGRVGIMAQAQLDDPDSCDANLIGTGPFMLEDWQVNDFLSTTRNPDYWATDDAGNQLPYLDAVTFRPFPEGSARTNALLGSELNAMHTSSAQQVETLEAEADAGNLRLYQSIEFPEVSYGMLNTAKPPFDNLLAREAAALAFNREQVNEIINLDKFEIANGPFGPGEMGYLDDTGWPAYDQAAAEELAEQYAAETGNPLEFTLTVPNTSEVLATAQLLQEQGEAVGVTINVEAVEQATLITKAIGGDYEAIAFRNHAGGDPDQQYIWWYGGGLTNFGKFDDPEINSLLDEGRSSTDQARRTEIYEDLNRRFATEYYNLWLNWTEWTIATDPDVYGLAGPDNPDGSGPFPGLADGHSLAGTWIAQ
ncbi:MAG: ABC transporter substrate-binding protein [Microthrixaceae bacterium]